MADRSPASTSDAWASLEHYAALLRALLPRTQGISLFNARGELRWSGDTAVDPEVPPVVAAALAQAGAGEDGGRYESVNSQPLYLFWLRRDDDAPGAALFAVLALSLRTVPDQPPRTFAFVHGLVRPALECLRRELSARHEITALHNSLQEQDQDLEMLLSVSGGGDDAPPAGNEDLKSIVASATEHLKVGIAALIVPEKGLVLMHAANDTPLDNSVLAKAHRHLLSLAQMRREPVIINRMQLPAGGGAPACVYRILACPVSRADGRAMGVLALFRPESAPEFTTHHSRLTQLLVRRIAAVIANSYDTLTGLLTRPAFEQRVQVALEPILRERGGCSALYLDLDRMHVINDTYGMPMGDRVISLTGELIRQRLPPGALAARISGDRFAILLPAAASDAAAFAEGLRQGIEALGVSIGDGRMHISISIGVANVEPRSREFAHALALAETACKAANDRGRNRVELYQETDASIVRRFTDINLVADLREAMHENRLQLFAQLIAPLGTHRGPPHFELLLRMIDPRGQTVGPDHFMSAATRYQLMPAIDRWVVGKAIEQLKPHAALLAHNPVVFTVNFSGQSLQDGDFTGFVTEAIAASGLNPAAFCFELTESAAVGNLGHAEVLMRRLRKLGCNIALDDFGTGLSSLAYLRALPIGMLKIDGSFVRDVLRDPRAESMVQAIAQLARSMSLVTVAEYVETEELRTRITALGVDYGQGFAIATPVPLVDVLCELPLYAAVAGSPDIWPREPMDLQLQAASGA